MADQGVATLPSKKEIAEHIPAEYRNAAGTGFYPGGDARYKSALINAALDYEEQKDGRTDSDAHRVLTEGPFSHWASHLEKAREVRKMRQQRKAAAAQRREDARRAREAAKEKRQAATKEGQGKQPSAGALLSELKTFVLNRRDEVGWTWGDIEVYPVDVRVDQGENETLVQQVLVKDSNENEHWIDRTELKEVPAASSSE